MAILTNGKVIPDAFREYDTFERTIFNYFNEKGCTPISFADIATNANWLAELDTKVAINLLKKAFNRLEKTNYIATVRGYNGLKYVIETHCPWDVVNIGTEKQFAGYINTVRKITGAKLQDIFNALAKVYQNVDAETISNLYLNGIGSRTVKIIR